MGEPVPEVVEGVVVDRDEFMTVEKLVRKLIEFDPKLPIFYIDGEYGEQFVEDVDLCKFDEHQHYQLRKTGLKAGEEYVVLC